MLAASELNQSLRSQGIGASEIGAVVGVDTHKTVLDVYAEKVGLSHFDGNSFTEWGHALEPIVRDLYAKQTGYVVRPGYTMQHPRHPIAIATPDTLVYRPGETAPFKLQQIKTTSNRNEWGDPGTDEVPERTIAQVTWEAFVAGAALGAPIGEVDVTPLFLDGDFRRGQLPIYTVGYEEGFALDCLRLAQELWDKHIVPRIPPEVKPGDERFGDYLKVRYPKQTKPMLQGDAVTREFILAYDRASEAVKAAEAEKKAAAQALQAIIGEWEGVEVGGCKATWKWQKGSTYTTTREAGRVLRVTVKEGK